MHEWFRGIYAYVRGPDRRLPPGPGAEPRAHARREPGDERVELEIREQSHRVLSGDWDEPGAA